MPSIGVLDHTQKPTDKPYRRVKRAGGQSLVRQMKAYWIKENVLLQMLDVRSLAPRNHTERTPAPAVYIPEAMPPVIDKRLGVRFEDPNKMPKMPRFRRLSNFDRMNQFAL